jgi:hypothetical protein
VHLEDVAQVWGRLTKTPPWTSRTLWSTLPVRREPCWWTGPTGSGGPGREDADDHRFVRHEAKRAISRSSESVGESADRTWATASRKECVTGEEEEKKPEREHVIASALFSLRARRSRLRDRVFLMSPGQLERSPSKSHPRHTRPLSTPLRRDRESVRRSHILPGRASRRRRAGFARTLSLCSLLAGLPGAWRRKYLDHRQQERHDRPAGRESASTVHVAHRGRREQFAKQSPKNRTVGWGLSCVRAAHQLPGHRLPAARMSDSRVCLRGARWVRSVSVPLLRFAPLIAHRLDPIPRLHGMLFYHAGARRSRSISRRNTMRAQQ